MSEPKREGLDPGESVRSYYEKNTGLFLSLGVGRKTLSMRRAVWADGVKTLPQAVDFVNGLISEAARLRAAALDGEALRVLDVGCGVGGSLFFLCDAIPAPMSGLGVTISPRQSEIARRQARSRGFSRRCSFLSADFSRISGLEPFHLAFAIESFVHFPGAQAFFAPAAASLAPGGRLILVDDFLAEGQRREREHDLVRAFRGGWVLPALCPVEHARQSAAEHGLRMVENLDLSAHLALLPLSKGVGRWAVRVLRALPVPWSYWRSTVGSLALAACQREGLVEYRFLVFEK